MYATLTTDPSSITDGGACNLVTNIRARRDDDGEVTLTLPRFNGEQVVVAMSQEEAVWLACVVLGRLTTHNLRDHFADADNRRVIEVIAEALGGSK